MIAATWHLVCDECGAECPVRRTSPGEAVGAALALSGWTSPGGRDKCRGCSR